MDIELGPVEVRVIGSLVEKSLATPDHYPLSLTALTAACNQKSSRDPVMSLREPEVQAAIDGLVKQALVRERNAAGGRVTKYAHRLDDRLGLSFGFSREELGVLCVLMLRGPQTPGDLRARCARLCELRDGAHAEEVLGRLAAAQRGPWVRELARRPGQREARWAHLFGGEPPAEPIGPEHEAASPATGTRAADRIDALEDALQGLRVEVEGLRKRLDQLEPPPSHGDP
jgi:uncharacterized protein